MMRDVGNSGEAVEEESEALPLPLPPVFLEFLKGNGIDPCMYAATATAVQSLPRYIRLKPGVESNIPKIESEFEFKLEPVPWLPDFFSIPPQAQIASSEAYRHGKIYGMDAASGAAVLALDVSPGDHVLDLCAAPGKSGPSQDKSNDMYGEWTSKRTWKERRTSRRAVQLNLDRCLEPKEPEMIFYGKGSGIVGLKKSALFQNGNELEAGYDKVLVDAECTHDGSMKHVCKFERWGWDTLERRLLDIKRINSITHLQLQLLNNGFRLLKVSGILIYSTCSFTITQNEGVLEKFLAVNRKAKIEEIVAAKHWPCKRGLIWHTLRFDPSFSKTNGLFIAKIVKMAV